MSTSSSTYDLIVIGTGSGGAPAAFRCATDGWRVAVIDAQPYGGTCALRGCDPKKVLIGGAQLTGWARRMQGYGISAAPTVDWPELMRFKRSFTDPVPEDRRARFEEKGINTYHGPARFTGEDTIEVEGRELHFEHLLLANGAKPAPLFIEGEEHLTTSTEFLEWDALPERIALVGGGYISFEFAHLVVHAGADEVTVVHRGKRPLERFEPDLVDALVGHTQDLGVTLHLEAQVTAVEEKGGTFTIHASQDGEPLEVEADRVVHGAGRVPALEAMNLEAGGVEHSKAGVSVSDHLQSTSNPRVWAAGDAAATAGLPLTPVAAMESLTVASNLRTDAGERPQRVPDYGGIPTVVFTTPPLASVGLTEAEARAQDYGVEVRYEEDITSWYSYKRLRSEAAAFKVVIDGETDRIVGAHLLGEGAEEMINLFGQAIRHGIPASELRRGVYAYPTHGSDLPHMV